VGSETLPGLRPNRLEPILNLLQIHFAVNISCIPIGNSAACYSLPSTRSSTKPRTSILPVTAREMRAVRYSFLLEQFLDVRHEFSFGTFCRYLDLTTDIMYRLQYASKHTQSPSPSQEIQTYSNIVLMTRRTLCEPHLVPPDSTECGSCPALFESFP